MPDIFDEVDEDLRAERAQQLAKRYGPAAIGGAVLIVGAVAGWQLWQRRAAEAQQAVAATYIAAMRQADGLTPQSSAADRAAAAAEFERLAASAPPGYRALGLLRLAALEADAGDMTRANAAWDAVASDSNADPLLRDLASLLWAQRQIDHGDPAIVEARLRPLAEPANPYSALAREGLAMLALRQGRAEQAQDALRKLSQDGETPGPVRERAAALLTQVGG